MLWPLDRDRAMNIVSFRGCGPLKPLMSTVNFTPTMHLGKRHDVFLGLFHPLSLYHLENPIRRIEISHHCVLLDVSAVVRSSNHPLSSHHAHVDLAPDAVLEPLPLCANHATVGEQSSPASP